MTDHRPPSSGLPRRDFLKIGGAATVAGAVAGSLSVMAGPFEADSSGHLIPPDKKLAAAWVKALYERGEPGVFEGDQLRHIGMPVGGIACGQLYLSGDGRLWHWDILRPRYSSAYGSMSMGIHYANPPSPGDAREQPLHHGFALRIRQGDKQTVRPLSSEGFRSVRFRGEYPIGRVQYRETFLPLEVDLEAFSPFVPLEAADSALPCTLFNYTLRNTGTNPLEVDVAGWLENAVCPEEREAERGLRRIEFQPDGFICSAAEPQAETVSDPRAAILFADFEGQTYDDWTVEGKAFGTRPFRKDELASFDQLQGFEGGGLVNTHETRAGKNDPQKADSFTGTLTSPEFTIQRNHIVFRIGGGNQPGKACLELLVDGRVIASETGRSDIRMRQASFDVRKLPGKKARLRITDAVTGAWGHVAVDHITFEDAVPSAPEGLRDVLGFGTLCLRLRGATAIRTAEVAPDADAGAVFAALDGPAKTGKNVETAFDARPAAAVAGRVSLAARESRTVTFLLAWHFPHYAQVAGEMSKVQNLGQLKRHYAKRFVDAGAVAGYVDAQFKRLTDTTRLWNRTWYDSTLPHWVLDRCFIPIDCLASTTLHWFDSGRVWAWEGTDCCPGTCQHVWNYAQGMARIFPELERTLREVTDYGVAFRDSGALDYRAECSRAVAHDGQCGTVMRVWREHTISADAGFLRRLWPKVKQSIAFMIAQDRDGNGILEGPQYNTLDQAWVGPMGWISSLYLGALAAGAAMADAMGDADFAASCRQIIAKGSQLLVDDLFDGEYFIHKPTDDYRATNTNKGCHIDQVLGQSWASQLGLPRVVAKPQAESALHSLWKYNFAPDAGGYRNRMQDAIKGGRWYAMPGEAGLLMTTWPKGGAEKAHGSGKAFEIGVGYFNECMNGFEYQAAAHMIYEGAAGSELVEHGLAVARAVHDRYAATKRNPYNEVECSDHYSRSMAGYGVFLALCGFEYNGPAGHIGFAPRVSPEHFRAPFTAAEGWGTFEQTISDGVLSAKLAVAHGKLKLSTVALQHPGRGPVDVRVNGQAAEARPDDTGRIVVALPASTTLQAGQAIELEVKAGASG